MPPDGCIGNLRCDLLSELSEMTCQSIVVTEQYGLSGGMRDALV